MINSVSELFLYIAVFAYACFLWSQRDFYKLSWKLKGPMGLPYVGSGLYFLDIKKSLYAYRKLCVKHGLRFFMWLMQYPFVYMTDPRDLKKLLLSSENVNKSTLYRYFELLTGNGVFTSKSPKWNHERKILNPSFTRKMFMEQLPLFNEEADKFSTVIGKLVDKGDVILRKETLLYAMVVTGKIFMDIDDSFAQNYLHFADGVTKLKDITMTRLFSIFLRYDFFYKMSKLYQTQLKLEQRVTHYFRKEIHKNCERIKTEELNLNKNENVGEFDFKKPEMFIKQAANEFSNDEVTQHAIVVLIGSYETTAKTLVHILLCLAYHPHYQQKVIDEINSIFPDENFEVTQEDLNRMNFTEMVINETLRLFPAVPVIGRDITNDIQLHDGVVLPKGTQVIIDIFNMHRNPQIWGEKANEFYPEHFLPENQKKFDNFAFIPYSKGPRMCIGHNFPSIFFKTTLAKLFKKYRFSTTINPMELEFYPTITLVVYKEPTLKIHSI